MTWRQVRVFDELRWFWDEGQRRRRFYRELPEASRVVIDHTPPVSTALGRRLEPERFPPEDSIRMALRVFGLDRAYTKDELLAAYRRLVFQHHPDRGGDLRTMQAIIEAHDWLRERAP
jgi:hypothetical protein